MDVQLIPFRAAAAAVPPDATAVASATASSPAPLNLAVRVSRQGDQLLLRYRLRDPRGLVRLPPLCTDPARRDGLWNHTCLEAFLAVPGEQGYWEINLAPSGDWNLYRLEGYRSGLRPEPAIASLPFQLQLQPQAAGLDLSVELDLRPFLAAGSPLELGLTAVLELGSGELQYWALAHPGPEADFHRREAFLVRL